MKRSLIHIALYSTIIAGCDNTKKIASPEVTVPPVVTETPVASKSLSLETLLSMNKVEYSTFSARIEVESQTSAGKNPDGVAKLLMKKDEFIWVSLQSSFLGIEAYRLFVTKDSVTLINKLKREVTIRPVSYLQNLLKLPLDLNSMQDLLLGKPVFYCNQKWEVIQTSNSYILNTECPQNKSSLTFNNDGILIFLKLFENNSSRNFQSSYKNVKDVNGRSISFDRELFFEDTNKMTANLSYSNVEFNKELSVSFTVPGNYEKK